MHMMIVGFLPIDYLVHLISDGGKLITGQIRGHISGAFKAFTSKSDIWVFTLNDFNLQSPI